MLLILSMDQSLWLCIKCLFCWGAKIPSRYIQLPYPTNTHLLRLMKGALRFLVSRFWLFFKSVIWFWLIFFAVLDDFFHGFAVSNRSQYPLLLSRFLSMAVFIIRHFKNTSWIPRSAFTGYCIQLHYKLFLLAFVHLLRFFFS